MKLFIIYLFIALSLGLAGQVYSLNIYQQQEQTRQIAQKDAIRTKIASKYSFTSTVTPNTKTSYTQTATVTQTTVVKP